MKTLGVYFGPQLISIVETKGKKPVNYVQIPLVKVSAGEIPEEKIPLQDKLIVLLKDELRQNNIQADEAYVNISGKDLIVRTFELPMLSRQELDTAVNFEAKKYIPFKIEDLISDFQYKLDKNTQKTRILFVGIKKETLDNYIYILDQLAIKIKSVTYSAFSVLQLLKLAKIKEKGIIAVVNIDIAKDDEANFVVLDNGFPLFSRDISLIGSRDEVPKDEANQNGIILQKLKREIQISLDYYERKFHGKKIGKIFFITQPNYRADLEGFIKDMGLSVYFIDVSKYIDKTIPFSLSFIKGYSSSLSKVKSDITIDLLAAKEKTIKKATKEAPKALLPLARYKSNFIVAGACLLICIIIFLSGVYRTLPLLKEEKNILNLRPAVSTAYADLGYEQLLAISSDYKAKISAIDNIIRKRLYVTPLLDAIPPLVPRGTWLVETSLKKEEGKIEVIIRGNVYLGDTKKEVQLVNEFLSRLKENPLFAKNFKEMLVVSTQHIQIQGTGVTNFAISCNAEAKITK